MSEFLYRYKILVIFIVALLAPSLPSIYSLIVPPFRKLIYYTNLNINYVLLSIIIYQFASLLWITLHKSVFIKKMWDAYLNSLPITSKQKSLSDLLLLILINVVIFIPLLIAYFSGLSEFTLNNLVLGFIKLILTISFVVLLQQSWITKQYKFLPFILLFDLAFALINTFDYNSMKIIFYSILLFIVIRLYQQTYNQYQSYDGKNTFNLHNKILIFPFTCVQVKNLSENRHYLAGLFISLLCILLAVFNLIFYASDNSHLSYIISIFMLLNSLIISNLFRIMQIQRSLFSSYLLSLPITKLRVLISDFCFVSLIAVFINTLIIFIDLYFNKKSSDLLMLTVSLAASLVFLFSSYYPQIKLKHYGHLTAIGIMSIFAWIEYLLFYRAFI